MADYFSKVPLEKDENLKFRIALRKKCAESEAVRKSTMEACRDDVLFWLSAFCWVQEPRLRFKDGKRLPKTLPFIPWRHQIPIIKAIRDNIGLRDIGVAKSRAEGLTWIAVLIALHDWIYDDQALIGFVSKDEATADTANDMLSLMAKLDWELEHLPTWMIGRRGHDWKRHFTDHKLINFRNKSSIVAYAATGDVGRGGRYKWFLMDEFAFFRPGEDFQALSATFAATDSRLFISTPNGTDNEYYRIMHQPDSDILLKLYMHWSHNETKNQGLYRWSDGKVTLEDPNNPLPREYEEKVPEVLSRLRQKGFRTDGVLRSPWYDLQCERAGSTPQKIAQELDLDYSGSKYVVFKEEFRKTVTATARVPYQTGFVKVNSETLKMLFDRDQSGPVQLWCNLDHQDRPPFGEYVMGVDLSHGSGGSYTSNSVVTVFSLDSREQVLEFASNTIKPIDFADICIGIAEWFWGAYLAWEINGPGGPFTKRVLERGYGNIYRRTVHWKFGRKKSKEVGWHTGEQTKSLLFDHLDFLVRTKEFAIRSKTLLEEAQQYILENGKIVHSGSRTTEDEGAKGQSHGDRVIAAAVALQAAKDRPWKPISKEEAIDLWESPPPGSIIERILQRDAARKNDDSWDDGTSGEWRSRASSLTAVSGVWED